MLSRRTQVARLRRLAAGALGDYPVADPVLTFVAHGENTTFRVDADGARGPERFLLRVHRPARHGRAVDASAAVRSELQWLEALRRDTDVNVPEPVRTAAGDLTTTASAEGLGEPRTCSLLRWMDGRIHSAAPRPVHLRRLGAAMAALHDHADAWTPPDGFVRLRWDHRTFFGDTLEYGGVNAADVWDLLPAPLRATFADVADRAAGVMAGLGEGPGAFGLIHADLHLDNALFHRGGIRLIDFDDCGTGHRVYDVAVALWELRHRDDYEAFRSALLDGYASRRTLPAEQLAHLDTFVEVREVAFALWYTGQAQADPAFRDDLDETLAATARSLAALAAERRRGTGGPNGLSRLSGRSTDPAPAPR